MSRILNDVKRSLNVQPKAPEPAPADTNGLGVAIQQLIDQAVHSQVEAAVEKQRPAHNPRVPAHLREFTDQPFRDTFPEPPPRTAPPKDLTVSLQRNEVGRVHKVSIGKTNFIVQRDSEGRVVRMVQED